MLKFTPILLAMFYGIAIYYMSAWRLRRELDSSSTELSDPMLSSMIAKMARVLDLKRIRVYVHETPVINGLAAPDGRIFVTRGFMDKYQAGEVRADELASVVAHELGHVALGHAKRRMIDFTTQNALRVAGAMVLNRFLPGLGPLIANALAGLLAARLSRSDEYEADAYAAALLTKAGIGTAPQIALFKKLSELTGHRGGSLVWTQSHPNPEDRIAAIEKLDEKWRP